MVLCGHGHAPTLIPSSQRLLTITSTDAYEWFSWMDYECCMDDLFDSMATSLIECFAIYNNIHIYCKKLKILKYMQQESRFLFSSPEDTHCNYLATWCVTVSGCMSLFIEKAYSHLSPTGNRL